MHVCSKCGKSAKLNELTKCDECGNLFCSEHIYAGTQDRKNLCSSCLALKIEENVRSIHVKTGYYGPTPTKKVDNLKLQKEHDYNKKIDEKTKLKQDIKKNEDENKPIYNRSTNINNLNDFKPKWQYRTIYLQLSSPLTTEYAVFNPDDNNPDAQQYKIEDKPSEGIDLTELNKLGEEGWEVVSEIPYTSTLMMRHNNDKYFSLAGGIVTGIHLLLKKMK